MRRFQEDDFNNVKALLTNPKVMRYTRFRAPQPDAAVHKSLEKWIQNAQGPFGVWAVENSIDRSFIGWVMLKQTSEEDPELGFMFVESQWGKGYASEVAKAMLRYAFENLKLSRVVALIDPDNEASKRVLVKIGI